MKRTVARQLAMVNWRGVFYERYLLDAGVTALEGVNGSGKTTVMVAAYVVLLPDQRYLRFDPLAEGGTRADDRGIWGRLGDGGDAYAALDFELGRGERLLAGVRLERKSADSGELHPFIVRGLPREVPLQRLLLERVDGHDEVPAPDRLAHLAAVAGGRLTWCESVSAYLRELFDAGVTPMPMGTESERSKLNELLRTSMMGGISRKLGDGLRRFLLRKEEGLAKTLRRIRATLDDCRRTRLQVTEARRLEQEIHQVLDAGAHMFAAAVEGARRFAQERQVQADKAARKEQAARSVFADLQEQQQDADDASARAERAETLAREAADRARDRAGRAERANSIWKRRRREERSALVLDEEAEGTRSTHAAAAGALAEAEGLVRTCERDHQESATGMADIQAGYERLHARASRYRAVMAALRRARELLPEVDFADEETAAILERCERAAKRATSALLEASGRLQTAQGAEAAFRRVHAALERLAGRSLPDPESHATALATLADLRREAERADRLPALRVEQQRSERLAERQEATRRAVAALASSEEPLATSTDLRQARDRAASALEEARDALSGALAARRDLAREVEAEQARVEARSERVEQYRRLRATVEAVTARWEQAVSSSEELASLLAWLLDERAATERRLEALEGEIAQTETTLQSLRTAGGSFPSGLPEACERVDGRLLVERFEEVSFDEAAEVEAHLGPLVHAILVNDPAAAARLLAEDEATPDTVWLLDGPRTELSPGRLPPGDRRGDRVAARVESGLRLSRLPRAPVVGRQARERLMAGLETALRGLEEQVADGRDQRRRVAADVEDVGSIVPKGELLDGPDPAERLAAASAQLEALRRREGRAVAEVESLGRRAESLKERHAALEALWPDADLLDPPDHAERATALAAEIARAVVAQRRIETARADRETLEQGLDQLRIVPPDAEARAELRRQVDAAERARERWLAPQPDLRTVAGDLEALGFGDAERKILEEEQMLASLREEVEAAERRLVEARGLRDESKAAEESAEKARRAAEASLQTCRARLEDLERELADTGIEDASDEALAHARATAREASASHEAASRARLRAAERAASLKPQVQSAAEALEAAGKERRDQEAQAGPAVARWEALQTRCAELGLLDAALGDSALDEVAGNASVDVFQLRQRWWALMLDRLENATDGGALAQTLAGIADATDEAGAEQFLRAWIETRSWLAERVPKHVSEVEDPVEALRRLRRHLDRLVDKLTRHERRLRGDSRDIVRAIEGRLRKVSNLLTKLNRDLRGVGFGSIEAMRVKSEREPRMGHILAALSSPEGQQDLFGPEVTIEEALDELFRRHGGRRGGGGRILDYREYLRLRVEVRRRGSETWEEARGNQMSTGEAIGVGAAIMMVVLTAWERDASLLRARRETGTLRFLFLDEATRLSQDNLAVLFDLCDALDLQLLIAAPEVATSAGNTTYLLERTTDVEGREVVHVSGRRAVRSDV